MTAVCKIYNSKTVNITSDRKKKKEKKSIKPANSYCVYTSYKILSIGHNTLALFAK